MIRCPSCQKELPSNASSCPACDTSVDDAATRRLELPKSPRSVSYDSIDNSRFVPGTMLAERYRIVGLLGKGGMGEVYRADDLKLGQPVALKFLPEPLLRDASALTRFHREVRVARQVSHKNVCRVYDIGEVNGHHFLSMEYIKGEELSSLQRRIGRLPADKAIQIARQICAGLAAAHESGVLHRDLKPSNIMIDGDGNARILDFGLAAIAEELREEEISAGTPAYMAPEQLDGETVTTRSDIYSLGLVLYELFTGKRAFEAASFNELINLRRSDTTPINPASIVKDLDPAIERVIERCIEKDPEERPASALQVAAALPGGDPIAAALAAGETPSPEMVAAAPKKGTLRPVVAAGALAFMFVIPVLLMVFSGQIFFHRMIPLDKSPDVLKERASQIAKALGYMSPPVDTAYGFEQDRDYWVYLRDKDPSLARAEVLKTGQPSLLRFWYRQGRDYLVPYDAEFVKLADPPNDVPGMVKLTLDTEGRLVSFDATPQQVLTAKSQDSGRGGTGSRQGIPDGQLGAGGGSDLASEASVSDRAPSYSQEPDWSILFREAGLDIADFRPAASTTIPAHAYDARAAWSGVYPNLPNVALHIEAAAYRDQPVYFAMVAPWSVPAAESTAVGSVADRSGVFLLLGLFFAILLGAALMAWNNLRVGRGDRRGAFRVALFLFVIRMLFWGLAAHHVPSRAEFSLLITGLQSALFWAVFVGLLYLALEPYLRRRWPLRIISWNRLVAGDFRDPLVGRDILMGGLMGSVCLLFYCASRLVPKWLGWQWIPDVVESDYLLGMRYFLAMLINQVSASLVQAFMIVFLLLFLSLLLRKDWLGIGVGFLITAAVFGLNGLGQGPWFASLFVILIAATFVFAAARLGPLALISALCFFHLVVFFPITTELNAWYATTFVLDLIVLLALAVYSYYISLGGQSPFNVKLLADD